MLEEVNDEKGVRIAGEASVGGVVDAAFLGPLFYNVYLIAQSSVRNVTTGRTISVRNVKTVGHTSMQKCINSENDFSAKCQYSKNDFSTMRFQ